MRLTACCRSSSIMSTLLVLLLSDRSQPQAEDWPAHWHVYAQCIKTLGNEVSEGQLVPIWQGVVYTTPWLPSLSTCSQQMADLSVEKSIS